MFNKAEQQKRAAQLTADQAAAGKTAPVLPVPVQAKTTQWPYNSPGAKLAAPMVAENGVLKQGEFSCVPVLDLAASTIKGTIFNPGVVGFKIDISAATLPELKQRFAAAIDQHLQAELEKQKKADAEWKDCAGAKLQVGDRVATTLYKNGKTSAELFVGTVVRFSKQKVEVKLATSTVMKFPVQLAILR